MNLNKLPISVCLIVKNEEKYLRDCLDSVSPFVSEIIVNDTGSTDSTLKILESYPEIQWFQSEWKSDFSYSRNLCLDKATQPWILSLDADEVVSKDFFSKIQMYLQGSFDGYLITILNHQNSNGLLSSIPHKLLRLFRNKPSIRFNGEIHEQISFSIGSGKIRESDLLIEHFGYQDDSKVKFERNISMLKSALEKKPKDAYLWYHLGGMHFSNQEFSLAIEAFNNTLIYESGKLTYDTLFTLYIKMSQCFVALKNYPKAEELVQITLHLDIKNPFPYYIRVGVYTETKNYVLALENLEKVKTFNVGYWKINPYQIELDFGNLYYLQDNFTDAINYYTNALKLFNESDTACYNLANCFFKLNMFKEAKEMYKWALNYNPNLISARENMAIAEQQLQGV